MRFILNLHKKCNKVYSLIVYVNNDIDTTSIYDEISESNNVNLRLYVKNNKFAISIYRLPNYLYKNSFLFTKPWRIFETIRNKQNHITLGGIIYRDR